MLVIINIMSTHFGERKKAHGIWCAYIATDFWYNMP